MEFMMFKAKVDDASVTFIVMMIMFISRKEFTECDQNKSCSDHCTEAEEVAFDILKEARDSVTFGFDSANKKAAKIAAQAAFYEFTRAFDDKHYSLGRQKMYEGVREVLINALTDPGRKIFADKIDVLINSPTLSDPIFDESHESHETSKLMLKARVFALKKELKKIGVFKGPIKD
jgi:hypothetical protein|tara:strand:+ start:290 stop:817 length:528 start_codon:yes stop_codon:yes gene_type:complete